MAKDQAVPEPERRLSQEQYDFLKQCSEKEEEGIKEWNEWRDQNPKQDILLEGVVLIKAFLRGIRLDTRTTKPQRGAVHLEEANLQCCDLTEARLSQAHLEKAQLNETILDGAQVQNAFVQGTVFHLARLWRANVSKMITDSATSLWEAKVDRQTDARGLPLAALRIDARTRGLLERNSRQQNWEQWYADENEPIRDTRGVFRFRRVRLLVNGALKWSVRRFWEISDYGISTKRIIWTFFKWAMVFAFIYYVVGALDYYISHDETSPGLVSNLFIVDEGVVPGWLVPFRAVYFSVVTMTTLGFGDIYANYQSFWGHLLLTLQVLLGYMLLGALVTRFAVLFTAGGPAGRFSKSERDVPN